MQIVDQSGALERRLAELLPDLRPPAVLLKQLTDVLAAEDVLVACGNLQGLGFGAYDGQLCLVTANRVVLATASSLIAPDGFGVEVWERQIGQLPRLLPHHPLAPTPREG